MLSFHLLKKDKLILEKSIESETRKETKITTYIIIYQKMGQKLSYMTKNNLNR